MPSTTELFEKAKLPPEPPPAEGEEKKDTPKKKGVQVKSNGIPTKKLVGWSLLPLGLLGLVGFPLLWAFSPVAALWTAGGLAAGGVGWAAHRARKKKRLADQLLGMAKKQAAAGRQRRRSLTVRWGRTGTGARRGSLLAGRRPTGPMRRTGAQRGRPRPAAGAARRAAGRPVGAGRRPAAATKRGAAAVRRGVAGAARRAGVGRGAGAGRKANPAGRARAGAAGRRPTGRPAGRALSRLAGRARQAAANRGRPPAGKGRPAAGRPQPGRGRPRAAAAALGRRALRKGQAAGAARRGRQQAGQQKRRGLGRVIPAGLGRKLAGRKQGAQKGAEKKRAGQSNTPGRKVVRGVTGMVRRRAIKAREKHGDKAPGQDKARGKRRSRYNPVPPFRSAINRMRRKQQARQEAGQGEAGTQAKSPRNPAGKPKERVQRRSIKPTLRKPTKQAAKQTGGKATARTGRKRSARRGRLNPRRWGLKRHRKPTRPTSTPEQTARTLGRQKEAARILASVKVPPRVPTLRRPTPPKPAEPPKPAPAPKSSPVRPSGASPTPKGSTMPTPSGAIIAARGYAAEIDRSTSQTLANTCHSVSQKASDKARVLDEEVQAMRDQAADLQNNKGLVEEAAQLQREADEREQDAKTYHGIANEYSQYATVASNQSAAS